MLITWWTKKLTKNLRPYVITLYPEKEGGLDTWVTIQQSWTSYLVDLDLTLRNRSRLHCCAYMRVCRFVLVKTTKKDIMLVIYIGLKAIELKISNLPTCMESTWERVNMVKHASLLQMKPSCIYGLIEQNTKHRKMIESTNPPTITHTSNKNIQ